MGGEWTRVKWSEAGQVTRALGWPARASDPPASATPRDYFTALRAAGRDAEAVEFMGQALPRWEAVAWAARSVRDLTDRAQPPDPATAEALKAALLWVQDPSESRRRQAEVAARAAKASAAERMAALAAFYSGGSIAPVDCDPLPAPRDAAGRCAAGAVLVAAARAPNRSAALARCLDAGAALAASEDAEAEEDA